MANSHVQDLPEVPIGWIWSKIKEVGEVITGTTPSKSKEDYYGTDYQFFKPADLEAGYYVRKSKDGLSKIGINKARLLPQKSILITCIGSIGKTGFIRSEGATNQQINAIVTNNSVYPEFIYFMVTSPQFQQSIIDNASATTLPIINKNRFENLFLPIPPLPEQHRIVSKVDELLDGVNSARERLARVPGILKQFRQSVLAAACSGRLTADWRIDKTGLEPALAEIDYNQNDLPEIPDEWRWSTVAMLSSKSPRSIQSGPFGSNLRHSEFQNSGILVLGIDNVLDGQFSMGRQHRISHEKFKELEKFSARPLDVLITVMATVGRCCVIPENIEPAIITKHVYRITVNRKYIAPFYLMFALRSNQIQNQIRQHIRGQTRPGINGQILKSTSIPVPPMSEQHEIVRRVEALFQLADAIEARVAAGAHRAEKLTQAILAKAFRGELVPTEAELARRGGRDYEPAAGLLARLKEERRLITEAQPRRQTLKGRKRQTAGT
jgi:type I restriction enzyme S subunit